MKFFEALLDTKRMHLIVGPARQLAHHASYDRLTVHVPDMIALLTAR